MPGEQGSIVMQTCQGLCLRPGWTRTQLIAVLNENHFAQAQLGADDFLADTKLCTRSLRQLLAMTFAACMAKILSRT